METKLTNYIASLKQMVDIPTISDGETFNKEVFNQFHNLLRELFPNVFKHFIYEEFDGSILLSMTVNSDKEPILLMSHHDVVSCEDNWTYDPFNATVADGKIYGRGTLDTKGNLWAILTAIEELLNDGYKFNRSIYIESACNEETSGNGANAISRELKKRGINFYFTLDEGGMIVYDPVGGAEGHFAMIAIGEKDYMDIKFIAKSKGGHSSTPDKNNPLIRLSRLILYIEKHDIFKPYLEDTTIETLKQFSKKTKGIEGFIFKHSKGFRHLLAKMMPKVSPTAASLVKSTICFTKAKGSDGYNIIPEEAFVAANLRISHKDNKEVIVQKLTKIANKFDIEVEIVDEGYYSPICDYKSEQYNFLCNVINDNFKDVICTPFISTGASDSKYFADLSKNNFRFAPFRVSDEQLDSMHAKDENIDIDTLIPAVEFFKDLIRRI